MTTDADQMVQPTEARCCANCRYFDRSHADPSKSSLTGQCRFNPPVVVADAEGVAASTWPTVRGGDWCGQFALALDAQSEDKQ